MKRESFDRAQQLYTIIHDARVNLKGIKFYEQHHYKHDIPLTLKVPYVTGPCSVDYDISIADKEFIKNILNAVKIRLIQKIQYAEKELEEL